MADAHAEPNTISIFWWLLALTILEIAVIYTPIARLAIIILLVGSALAGWISLLSKGLSRVFCKTTVQKHQFFGAQLSLESNSEIHT